MSCNLSLFSGVLVRGAVAFPACTVLTDPVLLRRLRGNGGSGCEAAGGADTGLFGCCSIACCSTRIRCLALEMVLRVTACPSLSRSWLMMLPMDLSSSSISGDVDAELLVEVVPVLLGLVVVDDASLLLDVPLELSEELELAVSLSVSWDTGNTTEGSFVMVTSESGCNAAEGEALGEGVTVGASACWSGMLSVTTCRNGISKSGSVTSNVTGLLCLGEGRLVLMVRAGIALTLLTGLSLNLVCLARLSGWLLVAVSETKTLDVSGGFEIFLFGGPERTVFGVAFRDVFCSLSGRLLASERTEFSFELSSPQGSSEGDAFDTCK